MTRSAEGGPVAACPAGVRLSVHAQPGAREDALGGLHGGRLRARTTAPPEGGKANARLRRLIARAFGLPPSRVELVAGSASRRKEFVLHGLELAAARRVLEELA